MPTLRLSIDLPVTESEPVDAVADVLQRAETAMARAEVEATTAIKNVTTDADDGHGVDRQNLVDQELPPLPKTSPTRAPMVENSPPLSFEKQVALSDAINLLPESSLLGAMQIIREADFIYQLDTGTKRKLQRFVTEVRFAANTCCVTFANGGFSLSK